MKCEATMTVGKRLPNKMAFFKSYLNNFRECVKPTSCFEASFPIILLIIKYFLKLNHGFANSLQKIIIKTKIQKLICKSVGLFLHNSSNLNKNYFQFTVAKNDLQY